MQTFLWLYLFLAGVGFILALSAAIGLVRFLFGGSLRLDRDSRPGRRRRGGLLGITSRVTFFLWCLMLFLSGMAMIAIARGGGKFGCALIADSSHVGCEGFAGAEGLAWFISFPALLTENTERLVALLQIPWAVEGMVEWPLPELALGVIGPVLLALAWLGFARVLGDVWRLWRV